MSHLWSAPTRRSLLAASAIGSAVGAGLFASPAHTETPAGAGASGVRPFSVHVPDEALADLRRRVVATAGRPRACRRRLAGRPAGDHAGAGPPLGDRTRLAQVRGEIERPTAVHHRDRRRGRPLHPRSFQAPERAAGNRHPRLARLDHRAAQDHRAADQPNGPWRRRGGRLRRGHPRCPARVLGQTHRHGWDPVRIARAWIVLMNRLATRATWRRAATGATPSPSRWPC